MPVVGRNRVRQRLPGVVAVAIIGVVVVVGVVHPPLRSLLPTNGADRSRVGHEAASLDWVHRRAQVPAVGALGPTWAPPRRESTVQPQWVH